MDKLQHSKNNRITGVQLRQFMTSTTAKTQVAILNSDVPTFNSGKYDEADLMVEIVSTSINYLDINSENTPEKNVKIAESFANHIIRTRSDWKPQDIPMLFNFMTDRKDIEACRIFGNKIMLQNLITAADAYEDDRIEAREYLHEARKFKERERDYIEPINNPHLREILDRLNKATEPKQIEIRTEPDSVQCALLDFDKAFYKSGKVVNGIRYAEINGTFVNQDKYLTLQNEL